MVDSSDVGPRRNLGASENWGRWNDERVTFAIRELEDLKVNLNGTARSIDGVAGGVAGISQTIAEGTAKPVPPSNTRITSNVSTWISESDAAAKVTVEWDAVSVGTAGEPINVIGYEVWVHNQSNLERGSYIAEALTGLKAALTLPVEIDATITTRAQGANGVWSDHSSPVKVTTAAPPSPTPKAPTNLTLVSNTPGWNPIGLPIAELSFTWDAVTKAIDNTNIGIARYELWEGTATDMGHPVRSVVTLEADVVLDSKIEATYRARACSSFGIWSDFSNAIPIVANVPPVDMTPPSDPTTVSGLATIEVKWDGLLAGSTPPPNHIANVLAYESANAAGPWVLTGPPLKIGGAITVRADKGVTRWFRFQTIDTLGRLGGVSAAVSGVAVGVTLPDVDQTITDAIEQATEDANAALESADGKSTVYYQTTAPTGGTYKDGDTWFDTDDGNKLYRRTGSSWVAVPFGSTALASSVNDAISQAMDDANDALSAASTADGRVTVSPNAPVAANGSGKALGSVWFRRSTGGMFIGVWEWTALGWVSRQLDNATIANLDAGKISTGILDAGRIAASSITTSKLTVGNFSNLVDDPGFSSPLGVAWFAVQGSWTLVIRGAGATGWVAESTQRGSNSILRNSDSSVGGFPVTAGDTYFLSARIYSNLSQGYPRLAFVTIDSTNAVVSSQYLVADTNNGWNNWSRDIVIPANAVKAQIRLEVINSDPATTGRVLFTEPSVTRKMSTDLIVDGAVIARTIDAQAVTAEKLAVGAIKAGSAVIENGAISSAQIASLDAGKITAGTLDAARIAAKSIMVDKLVVASTGNMLPNGDFALGNSGWSTGSHVEVVQVTDGPGGATANVMRHTITSNDQGFYSTAFKPSLTEGAEYVQGATYNFRIVVRVISGTAGNLRVRLGFHGIGQGNQWPVVTGTSMNLADAVPGQWYELEGSYETLTNNPRNRMSVSFHASGASGGVVEVAEFTARPMASSNLIVDGAVTARKVNVEEFFANEAVIDAATIAVLRAGVVETSMLSGGVGDNLDITSNSSITLLTGQAADTQGQVDALQTHIRVDSTGLTLGATGNPLQAQMRPGAFAILDNGIETTYWESGRMVVPSLVTEEVVLSNHKAEKYGTGTVWRTT